MPFALPARRLDQVRQTLCEERNLLEVLLDSVNVAVVACDAEGRVTHVNQRTHELMSGACSTGLDPEGWIEALRPRTVLGLPLELSDLPLVRAVRGEVVRDVDILIQTDVGEMLLSTSANPVEDEQGRRLGAVVVFEDVTERRALEAQLRDELRDVGLAIEVEDAIDSGRLLLYAQPIIDLSSGATVMEELLLRIRSADGTISGPCGFLSAAERYSTITSLDRWVFEQAARLAGRGRPVTVNVSARTVGRPSFLEVVEHTLERNAVEPSLITFEITETAIVSDIVKASRFAERLDAIGCHFALDDFGTGYAALTYLKHLPIQYLKIDIDFVRDLVENPRSRAVVSAIVTLAAGFGQRTIAEGVENAATLTLLRELGVDLAQGFHIGRPAPITTRTDG
jgi:EAL domain-containing protein (putative c-di-GMP-specific phosphodiesterase class I)